MNTEEEKRSPLLALPGWGGLEVRDLPGTSQDILQLLQQMKLWVTKKKKKEG